MKRKLKDLEYRAILELSQDLNEQERNQLITDLKDCNVEEATRDGSRLTFFISGYSRPVYHGQHAYMAEGTVNDDDGTELTVVLHADENNRVLELELIKWNNTLIIKPDWITFKKL